MTLDVWSVQSFVTPKRLPVPSRPAVLTIGSKHLELRSPVTENAIGMKSVLIPPGEFEMESPASESERDKDQGPVHRVPLTKPLLMGQFEVTQEEFQRVMGAESELVRGHRRRQRKGRRSIHLAVSGGSGLVV